MLTSIKEILTKAQEGGYAVGAFNLSNMETAQGILMAAVERRSPLIVQITESTMKFAGAKEIAEITRTIIKERSGDIPIGINLDHGKTFEVAMRCIDLGFNGVMIDGSRLSFEENLNLTKRVVDYAHEKQVTVQAELGVVPYLGESDLSEVNWKDFMTDPEQARQFVEATGADSLAIGIGNAHGFFRELENCDWDRLAEIREKIKIPLVIHGSSDWLEEKIIKAVEGGVSCFNVDTDLRLAFVHTLCQLTDDKCAITDPRNIMDAVRNAIKKKVIEKIHAYGSANKA